MSYGKADRPCVAYKYWPTNPGLCGVCAWEKDEHNGRKTHSRNPLQPHEIRMIHELRDLEEKREKLQIFLGNEKAAQLSPDEQARMNNQNLHMSGYAEVLRERINAFL